MEYRNLGKSGLKVSEVALGANSFGRKIDEPASTNIINLALEKGINFIDTAEQYSDGRSEEIIGRALKGKRPGVVIASKFGHIATIGPNESRGSRNYLMKAVEGSLRRLNTDYIDLYSLHYPDPETPIEETLRAMDDLVHAGKVRYIGCSNFDAWQICEGCWTSKLHNLQSFIAVELEYNLFKRGIEAEAVPCCQEYSVGVLPWGPLAGGFLTGKYHRDNKDEINNFLSKNRVIYRDSVTDANFEKMARWTTFAEERGHSVGELAIAWLLSHRYVGSVLVGATSTEQFARNVSASDWKLTQEDLSELNKIL